MLVGAVLLTHQHAEPNSAADKRENRDVHYYLSDYLGNLVMLIREERRKTALEHLTEGLDGFLIFFRFFFLLLILGLFFRLFFRLFILGGVFQITDPKLYTYGVEHPISAIENLSATTLRNIIGEMELDATLTSRDTINAKIRVILDEATDPWGIKVNRVELKNIIPPREIQDAMEKQMKAERHRREAILTAEGEKASKILVAEGHKESQILNAEAEKQAAILHAEAVKEAKIREAEGEAEAILAVQKANAKAIELINEAAPSDAVIAIKSLEAFSKAADGKATKIIIPSEIQSLAGLAASLKELVTEPVAEEKNDSFEDKTE